MREFCRVHVPTRVGSAASPLDPATAMLAKESKTVVSFVVPEALKGPKKRALRFAPNPGTSSASSTIAFHQLFFMILIVIVLHFFGFLSSGLFDFLTFCLLCVSCFICCFFPFHYLLFFSSFHHQFFFFTLFILLILFPLMSYFCLILSFHLILSFFCPIFVLFLPIFAP